MILLAAGLAVAAPPDVQLGGDIKSFFVATLPFDNPLFGADPSASGTLDGRLKLSVSTGLLRLDVHHAITATTRGSVGVVDTGAGGDAPEALELSWVAVDEEGMRLQGRTDRLVVKASVPGLDVALGRQPISFGSGFFFTPMDLVNPFFPSTIDQEYKPGVDALRVDGYLGMSTMTAVAAYAGDWSVEGLVFAGYGQTTVGLTDLGLFVGAVRGDAVVGLTTRTALGPVGIVADVTGTLPSTDEDPFVRGVVGGMWRPFEDSTVTGEVYVQSLGTNDPNDFLAFGTSDRFARGELWLLGRVYAGVAWSQQLTPLVTGSVSTIANLEDPSGFVSASIAWSAAENATVSGGGFVGVGERPEATGLASEFGTYPASVFVTVSTYF